MSDEQQPQPQQQQEAVDERIVSFKIKLPETEERLEVPCSVNDSIFDIAESLKVLPSTREYTAYELKINGEGLHEDILISELVSEEQDSVSAELVPSPYNDVTSRKHVLYTRIYAGLDTVADKIAEVSGTAFGASTYAELQLDDSKSATEAQNESTEKSDSDDGEEPSKEKSLDLTEEEKEQLSTITSEICELKKDLNIVAAASKTVTSPALKSLYISQWTPSSNVSKLAGDLFYLQAQTLEGEIFNITAHVSGFFVNTSNNSGFNGSIHQFPTKRSSFNYSLVSLLKSLSSLFGKQIEKNDTALAQLPLETYALQNTAIINSPWLVEKVDVQTPDLGKSQQNLLLGGVDGADLQQDWNKSYQILKDIPHDNLSQRINREQSLISTSADFTSAATKGAMAIVRGDLEPINPEEDAQYHIYVRNGIFYSNAIDSIGQFQSTGGAEAARFAAGKDVVSLKYLNRYDIKGVYSLLTTVVDYCGRRIVCQAPVPGLIQNDTVLPEEEEEEETAEQTVKYGFIDDHSDVVSEPSFVEKFKEIGAAFHLKPHKIWNNDGSKVVDVVTSGCTKGTTGSDKRSYVIDLFRTTPLDIEFIDEHFDASKPSSYPHREASLRHEAVAEWVKRETVAAIKKETERLEKEGKLDDNQTMAVDDSLFLLNPDAFTLPAAPTPELAKELKSDEDKVREVSKFVGQVLVPEFVKEMESNEVYNAMDGKHLTQMLHEYGINVRYLGKIATLAAERKTAYLKEQDAKKTEIAAANEKALAALEDEEAAELKRVEDFVAKQQEAAKNGEEQPDVNAFNESQKKLREEREKAQKELPTNLNTIPVDSLLESLYRIAVQEMVARGVKNYLRKELSTIPLPLVPYVLSHVHNCLLASKANPCPEAPKLNSLLANIYKNVDLSILETDSKTVIAAIAHEVSIRYRFDLAEDWIDAVNTVQLMRSIAVSFGIQWKKRDFAFSKDQLDAQIASQKKCADSAEHRSSKKDRKSSPGVGSGSSAVTTTFVPEDIVCIVPVVKNSIFEATSISDAWEAGVVKLTSEDESQRQEGFLYVNQSASFCERLYGPVHNINASYLTKLGNLYLNTGASSDAALLFKKAFQIFERTSGIDSFQSALALNQLANALVSTNQIVDALKVYKRLLNYWILAFDETHPNVTAILTAVFVILLRFDMKSEAVEVTLKALEINEKAHGELSQQAAFFNQKVCELLCAENKIKQALTYAEKALEGYKVTLGFQDRTTVEARKAAVQLKNYIDYIHRTSVKKEQEARKSEQAENIKAKELKKSQQAVPNPEIASKSIDDILAFIGGEANPEKKKKKKNGKKKSKK